MGIVAKSDGVGETAAVGLMMSMLVTSLGYGITLPMMPTVVGEALGMGMAPNEGDIAWHTGALAAVYLLAQFAAAPAWGRILDVRSTLIPIVLGLAGLGVTTALSASFLSLWGVYAERVLSGLFAAAVAPGVIATISRHKGGQRKRSMLIVLANSSSMAGFFLGPMLGVWLSRISGLEPVPAMSGLLWLVGGIALTTAIYVLFTARSQPLIVGAADEQQSVAPQNALVSRLPAFAFLVSLSVAVFEVGLSLRETMSGSSSQGQVALMFAECSAVMFLAQFAVLLPSSKAHGIALAIGPSMITLGAAVWVASLGGSFGWMLLVTAVIASTAGFNAPALSLWMTLIAGPGQGRAIGKLTAATSLGGAIGSLLAGNAFGRDYQALATLGVAAALTIGGMLTITTARRFARA